MSRCGKLVAQAYDQSQTPVRDRDPELATQIEQQVTEVAERIEQTQQVPSTESYLQKVGRIKAIRRQAEELVLADLLPRPDSSIDQEWAGNLDAILALGPTDPDHPLNAHQETMIREEYAAAYQTPVPEQTRTHQERIQQS